MLRKKLLAVFLTCVSSIIISLAQQLPDALYADIVFHNGYVLTVDRDRGDFTVVKALAVKDGKIVGVGSSTEILKFAGPRTKKIDLERHKAVIPGIINTHTHPNRYAKTNYFSEIPSDYQKLLTAEGVITWTGKRKDQILSEMKQLVEEARDSQWVKINGRGEEEAVKLAMQIARPDLDGICPDKPLVFSVGGLNTNWYSIVNSKVLERLLEAYPNLPGLLKDDSGKLTGHLFGAAAYVLKTDIMPQIPPQVLVPIYKKELEEHWLPLGVTTIATRLNGTETKAYSLLDQRGEMPLRIAYGHEVALWNPLFERDIEHLGITPGHGTEKLWMAGVTMTLPDSAPYNSGSVCSSYPKREILPGDFFEEEGGCWWDLPGDNSRKNLLTLARLGYRTVGMHTYGDRGLEIMLEGLEQARREGRQVEDLRFAFDHSMMLSPAVAQKAGSLKTIWSMASHKLFQNKRNADLVARVYGKEVVENYYVPVKRLLDSGAKVTYESSPGSPTHNPMFALQVYVTRKVGSGQVVGGQQAVDRRTALRMMTRWGAEYVFREKELGSIEPGKWADLVVLEKNPLDPAIPDDKLGEIKTLMTVVGGKIAYSTLN